MKLLKPNNHVVTEFDGENYIVDTGSPFSFRFNGKKDIEINGRAYSLSEKGICPKEMADKLTRMDISGFIGLDIISGTNLTISFDCDEIEFSSDRANNEPSEFCKIPFDLFMGVYIRTDALTLGNHLDVTIIDTGAYISYLSDRHIGNLIPTGKRYIDENPETGTIEGELYRGTLELDIGGKKLQRGNVEVGTMPKEYDMFGTFDAFISPILLSNKCVVFDFAERVLWVWKE